MPQPEAIPPSEFRIWQFGKISTTKGEFLFDDAAGKSVLASFKQYGNRLTIDYEHMAVDPNRRAGDGKCAGSFLLELRADGLYAVDVRWTPPAAQALAHREWLYFSPYFSAEEGSGRILDLINLALTNIPATRSMTPLVAAHRSLSMATAGSSNLSASTTASSTTTAADDDAPADRPPTAIKQGKITPAERAWALSYGMESPEKLRGFLDVTPSRATVPGAELREPRRGAGGLGGAVALSDVERRICENAGHDPEKFALAKQRPIRTAAGGTR